MFSPYTIERNSRIAIQSGHDCSLSNTVPFFFHKSPYQSTPQGLRIREHPELRHKEEESRIHLAQDRDKRPALLITFMRAMDSQTR
jgi:hypothetical protein